MFNLNRWIFSYLAAAVAVAAQPTAPPKADTYGLYTHFDPALEILVIVLVCSFSLVIFVSIYIRQCAEYTAITAAADRAAASARQGYGRNGLDPAVIKSLPVFVYSYVKDLKIGKGALECAICLSEFEGDENLRLIPKCSHVFHPDCIEAWFEYHVTCPVCRAKLTPDPDCKLAESIPPATESNSNNDSSSRPTTEEENTEYAIQVNEEPRPSGKITGKFPRSHSTGHSLVCSGENVERYTLRMPEEIRKQIIKSGKLKRTLSYDIGLERQGSSRIGGDGSSRGRIYIDRWTFLRTPPFVAKMVSVKPEKSGEGDGELGSTTEYKSESSNIPRWILTLSQNTEIEFDSRW